MTAGNSDLGLGYGDDATWLSLDARQCPGLDRLAAADPAAFPFLMESSAGARAQSRYDLLLAEPGQTLAIDDPRDGARFFDALDREAASNHQTPVPDLPFIGGWFIYLGYEMAAGVEPSLSLPEDPDDPLPRALAVRCHAGFIHDRHRSVVHVVVEGHRPEQARALAERLYDAAPAPEPIVPIVAEWQEDRPEDYRCGVIRAREYIAAGDVFQVNLARSWQGRLAQPAPPADVYRALRQANPAPFSGLIQWAGAALICSSPERLLRQSADTVSVRPIAGTRRRRPGHDDRLTAELIAHPKERAEHIMLIDLVRNDLGRVCRAGTVAVDELMTVESYAHVHHIVSNVRGDLLAGIGPGSALRAVFPGGTITGCPKVRCMEIIAELEGRGRGAYTGSFGYLSRCGQMDTNIVIRSVVQNAQRLVLRTGAGIVADSDPDAELAETRHKARGVLRAFVDDQGRAHA